jgi:hypothetical protein
VQPKFQCATGTSIHQDCSVSSPHLYPTFDAEPFILSDDELREAWGDDPPKAEREVVEAFSRLMSPTFKLHHEVNLKHYSGAPLRIDFVGLDRQRRIEQPIGFELKRGGMESDDFSTFTHAVRQATDYAKSTIQDDRARVWVGAPLRFVFVFPCPYLIYENDNRRTKTSYRDLWAQGVLKLSTEAGVGAISRVPRKHDWGFFLAGHPAWWLSSGPTPLALSHARSKNVGSAA